MAEFNFLELVEKGRTLEFKVGANDIAVTYYNPTPTDFKEVPPDSPLAKVPGGKFFTAIECSYAVFKNEKMIDSGYIKYKPLETTHEEFEKNFKHQITQELQGVAS